MPFPNNPIISKFLGSPTRLIMCKSFADHGHSASAVRAVASCAGIHTRRKVLIDGWLGISDRQIAAINVKKMKKEKVWQNAHKGETK
jgi:hypothetical protein